MLLSALSFLVVAQSSSEVPEVLMNNPVVYFLGVRVFTTSSYILYVYTTSGHTDL